MGIDGSSYRDCHPADLRAKTNELQREKRDVNANWIKRVISLSQWHSNEYEWIDSKRRFYRVAIIEPRMNTLKKFDKVHSILWFALMMKGLTVFGLEFNRVYELCAFTYSFVRISLVSHCERRNISGRTRQRQCLPFPVQSWTDDWYRVNRVATKHWLLVLHVLLIFPIDVACSIVTQKEFRYLMFEHSYFIISPCMIMKQD